MDKNSATDDDLRDTTRTPLRLPIDRIGGAVPRDDVPARAAKPSRSLRKWRWSALWSALSGAPDFMQRPFILLTLTSIMLGACGGGKNDSDSEASGSTGATSTEATTAGTADTTDATDSTDSVGMSSTPTTGGEGSGSISSTVDSDPGTATESTAGGVTTTSAGETTSGTTGGEPDLMQLCEGFCAKNAECNRVDPDGCVQQCFQELAGEDECSAAMQALFACMLGLTCEQFVAFTDDDDPGPCAPQADAAEENCAGNVCNAAIGSNEEGDECAYILDCPDDPEKEFNCGPDTCLCLEGGKEVGQCPAEGVCMEIGGLPDKATACCGF